MSRDTTKQFCRDSLNWNRRMFFGNDCVEQGSFNAESRRSLSVLAPCGVLPHHPPCSTLIFSSRRVLSTGAVFPSLRVIRYQNGSQTPSVSCQVSVVLPDCSRSP